MKKYFGVLGILALLCMSASAGMASWTDDFSGYPVTTDEYLSSPWINVSKIFTVGNGYDGNGVTVSPVKEDYANLGQAFRATGDANMISVSARFIIPENVQNQGGMSLGLLTDPIGASANFSGPYIKLEAYKSSATVTKLYFVSNIGSSVIGIASPFSITSGEWWDYKLEKVDGGWQGAAKLATATDWMIIGTATGDQISTGFVPNYVGIAGCYNSSVMDNVTLTTPESTPPVPEPGAMLTLGSGLLGLAGYVRLRKRG